MTTLRFALRPLVVGAMAVLFGLYLALGAAAPANAQVPDDPEGALPDDPDLDDDGLDDDGLLDLGDLLDLDDQDLLDLENLDLDELLALLGLLGTDDPPAPAPQPDPVAPQPPAAAPVTTPAPAPQQVTQRPVGGVAAGAGGASEPAGATTLPLVALGALALAGTATVLVARGRTA